MRSAPPPRIYDRFRARLLARRLPPRLGGRTIAPFFVFSALLVSVWEFVPAPRPVPGTPTATARAVGLAPPDPAPVPPTATVTVSLVEPTETPRPTALVDSIDDECGQGCLVRMPGGDEVLSHLQELGVTPSYAADDVVWTTLTGDVARELRDEGIALDVLERSVDTLPLYLVRLPEGGDPTPVHSWGDVIDAVDRSLLVRSTGAPSGILSLVDARIAIEKFPPAQVNAPGPVPDLGDPWAPASLVSGAAIAATITDLQGMGSDGGHGTRHYATAGNVEAAEYLFSRLAELGLSVWYEDFIADNGLLAVNVVGEIAGRDPSKIYLLTAHFDSIASDTNDPAVAPGALDNGSGVAALIEVASVLARYELRHPVHIVFLNAEEVGLQGAQAFANRTVAEGRPYAAAFNVDAIGAPLATNRLIVNADAESLWIQSLLVEINSLNGGLEIDLWPRQNPAIVADHTRLSQAGIPSVLLASVMYGDPLINQSNDTLDQVDTFRVQRITQLIVLTLGSLLM